MLVATLVLVASLNAAPRLVPDIEEDLAAARAGLPGGGWVAAAVVTPLVGALAVPYGLLIANPLCFNFFYGSCPRGDGGLGAAVSALGAVGIVGGISWLVGFISLRLKYSARIEALERERESAEAPAALRRSLPRIHELREARPGFGPVAALMATGTVFFGVGAGLGVAAFQERASTDLLIAFAVTTLAGAVFMGNGVFQLSQRIREREEIDRELEELQAPVGVMVPSRLPQAPTFVGYAWSF